jgi:hypothetical protein
MMRWYTVVREVGWDGVDVPLEVVQCAAQLVRQDAVLHDVGVAAPLEFARACGGGPGGSVLLMLRCRAF